MGPEVLGSRPGHATILLDSNLGEVVYSHCFPSLLTSKKLEIQRGVFGLDRFNGLTGWIECVGLSRMAVVALQLRTLERTIK